jgi:Kef-type K+ transport system membrane component KefB/nucleotide-binding universal stress UspA family protein
LHTDVLILLIQIAGLLLLARLLGELAQHLGQPAVVGEIFAGIFLGPTLLGNIPIFATYMVPTNSGKNYLTIISMLGAMFLLFIAGMETDIKLIKHYSKKAFKIALTALFVSFVSLFLYSLTIPDNLLINPNDRYVFSAFFAITISVSAISVIAKVLIDLNLIRRDFGQLFVAIGMIDEVTVWILISIFIGFVGGLTSSIGGVVYSFAKVILFIVLGYVIGKFFIKHVITFFQNRLTLSYKFLTLIVVVIFIYGAIAQALGLEAVLGAFVSGIVFGQVPYLMDETIDRLESITFGIFAPIFFASAGLQVNIQEFSDPAILILTVSILLIAFSSKALGGYVGSRYFAKSDHWTSMLFAVGTNTRGTIQIIVATIGLTIGLISKEIFSIIILISIISSIIAPIFIKLIIRKVEPNTDEIKRIKQEEIYAGSILSKINRILLPLRVRTDLDIASAKSIESNMLEAIASKKDISVTLFTITNDKEKTNAEAFLDGIASTFKISKINKKVVVAENALDKILEEAKKDYDLLVIGATEKQKNSGMVFNSLTDNLIRFSPCPSLIVQGHSIIEENQIKKILVPTDGSKAAKRAAEVAFALTTKPTDEVHILRVVEQKPTLDDFDTKDHLIDRQFNYAHEIVNSLKLIGESLSVNTFTKVVLGENPENEILKIAKDEDFNLVIIGSDVRPGSDKLYLGPRVERILANSSCPVIIVNSF